MHPTHWRHARAPKAERQGPSRFPPLGPPPLLRIYNYSLDIVALLISTFRLPEDYMINISSLHGPINGPIHLIANPNVCLSLLLHARKQSTPVPPCESLRAVVKYKLLQSFVCRVPFQMENPGGYHHSHSARLVATTIHTAPGWWLPPSTQRQAGSYHLPHSARLVATTFNTAPGPQLFRH